MDTLLTEIMMSRELRESIQSEETQLLTLGYHEHFPCVSPHTPVVLHLICVLQGRGISANSISKYKA